MSSSGARGSGPQRADGAVRVHDVRFNSGVILDTDSVFHGVDRVLEGRDEMPRFAPGMQLRAAGSGRWRVTDGDRVVGEYSWEDMRFSVSWKAYCFRDEAERESWRTHERDLSLDRVLDTLCNDLRQRERIGAERPANRELAEILVDEYVRFPSPTPD